MIIKGKENKVLSIIKENIIVNCLEKGYLPLVMMDGSPESFVNFAAATLATPNAKYFLCRYSNIPIYLNIAFLSQYQYQAINRPFKDINFPHKLDLLLEKEEELLDTYPCKFNDYLIASLQANHTKYKIIGNKSEDLCRFNIYNPLMDNFVFINPLSFISHGEILQILSTNQGYVKSLDFKKYRTLYEGDLAHIGKNLFSKVKINGEYESIGLLEKFNRTMDMYIDIPCGTKEKVEILLRTELIDITDIISLMGVKEDDEIEAIKNILRIQKEFRDPIKDMLSTDQREIIKDCLQ